MSTLSQERKQVQKQQITRKSIFVLAQFVFAGGFFCCAKDVVVKVVYVCQFGVEFKKYGVSLVAHYITQTVVCTTLSTKKSARFACGLCLKYFAVSATFCKVCRLANARQTAFLLGFRLVVVLLVPFGFQ